MSGSGPEGRVPVPHTVTLEFQGQHVAGTAGCNHYSGDVVATATTFQSKGLFVTGMGCYPRKRMVAEKRYIAALEVATTINRNGGRLTLSGGAADLEFELVPPPEPAPFEETEWRLVDLSYGEGMNGTVGTTDVPGWLTFHSNGRLTGDTGCRTLDARWRRDGDVVTVTDLPQGLVDCQRGGDQNDHILDVLGSPFTAQINGPNLSLQQVDGDLGVGYSAGNR